MQQATHSSHSNNSNTVLVFVEWCGGHGKNEENRWKEKLGRERGDDTQQGHKLDSDPQHLEYMAAGWEITTSQTLATCGCDWWACLLLDPVLAANQPSFGVWFCSKKHIRVPKRGRKQVKGWQMKSSSLPIFPGVVWIVCWPVKESPCKKQPLKTRDFVKASDWNGRLALLPFNFFS